MIRYIGTKVINWVRTEIEARMSSYQCDETWARRCLLDGLTEGQYDGELNDVEVSRAIHFLKNETQQKGKQ